MEINSIHNIVEKNWDLSALPALKEYIRIPALSPGFTSDWMENLLKAVHLTKEWCSKAGLTHADIRVLADQDRTPALVISVEDESADTASTTLFYGHLDKQPEASGWDPGKGPWQPVLENNRLFGRGSVDDGYAVFSAVIAIKALQESGYSHGRCVILIETGEESGSPDLPYYLETYAQLIGTPDLIVCLDSGCGDWDRLWVTTSLRGYLGTSLHASLLTQDIHSGASNMVASSFRILRRLLDRIEDPATGQILLDALHTDLPEKRLAQIRATADLLGPDTGADIPLVRGGRLMETDPVKLMIAATWEPSLTVTGADGLPHMDAAANVLNAETGLALSFRIPPRVDVNRAAQDLKTALETDPPYGAKIRCDTATRAMGWDMPDLGIDLERRIEEASKRCFGTAPGFMGEGGSIPFMTLLSEKFPHARFLVTGALGPQANAHGPNEFLDIPYVKKLTTAIAAIIARK